MNSTMKTLTSMLFFTAAGYVAGILMAPDKGVKTRKKLKKDAEKKMNELEKFSENKFKEGTKRYRKEMKKMADVGDKLLQDAKESVAIK